MFRNKQRDINITVEELRDFERIVAEVFQTGMIHGPVHLSYGNEDYLIELFKFINEDDWVFSTWRNHYHALLHGVPRETLLKDILQGKSISFQYPPKNFFTSAIVNGIIPIAVGTAMGIKWKEEEINNKLNPIQPDGLQTTKGAIYQRRMVWCFVGDMAASSGVFYEAVKYSVFNDLPIHFVIENNTLSTNTPSALSWGLKEEDSMESINPAIEWMTNAQQEKYISYFEYTRDKYPHQGTGKWVHF